LERLFEDPRLIVKSELLEWFPPRSITSPKILSQALSSVADSYAPYLFAIGLISAAFLALVVVGLASSWAIVEAMGWQKTRFFSVYVAESIPAVLVPIFYPDPLALVLGLMVAFVFVLAGPGILMGKLSSDTRVMGGYVSKGPMNVAYWLSLAAILSFGFVAVFATL
jgi:Mn2+/Fe2+ NRAMP family transporter